MKKLMIVCLSILLLVGCDPTSNERPSAIELNGDSTITLTVGDAWVDPGAYVEGEDLVEVSVSGTVDTSIADTYEITYSYIFEGVTISKKRTVIVEEILLSDVLLNGDKTITLTVGDTYYELGAYVDGDNSIVVSKTGTVNTLVPGTYTITYSYTVNGETKSATRTIEVVNSEVVFTLNGDDAITIVQDSIWVDPGYIITPSSTNVVVTDSVDSSTPGSYQVTYLYSDGVVEHTVTRDVEVKRAVFYVYNSYILDGDTLTVDITGTESSLKYFSFELVLYKDDVILERKPIVDGVNSLEFMNVIEGHTYKLQVVGAYYEEMSSTPSYDETIIETFTREITIELPEMTITNEVIGIDSYSFDYTIADSESRFLWFEVRVFDGDTLVNDSDSQVTESSGSINILELEDFKDYRVLVILTYDQGTTNIEYNIVDKIITTKVNFSVTVEVEVESTYVNQSNTLVISLNNPNAYTVESIYIDGVLQSHTVIDSLTIHIDLNTSVAGEFVKKIDIMVLNIRSVDETFDFDEEFSYQVVEQLAPENIPYVTNYFSNDDEYDTRSGGTGHTMQLELHNPLQLEISNILLDGVELQDIYIYSNDGEVITFFEHFEYRVDKHQQNVTGFTYTYGGVEYNVVVDSFNAENIPLCEVGVTQVSTIQDVKDMVQDDMGRCYELMNDIDLVGVNWIYELGSNQNSSITLFGNGYTISNVTMTSTDVTSASDTYWGLFRSLNGAHIQDLNITVDYNLGNSYNGKLFVGGLTGYMYDSFIENVSVSGSISSNWFTNGYVGGLVGLSVSTIIEELNVTTNVDVTQHTPTISSILGSIAGEVQNTEIHGYIDSSSIIVTGVMTHENLIYDTPFAVITSSNIIELQGS